MKSFLGSSNRRTRYYLLAGDFVGCLSSMAISILVHYAADGDLVKALEHILSISPFVKISVLFHLAFLFLSSSAVIAMVYLTVFYVMGLYECDLILDMKRAVIKLGIAVFLTSLLLGALSYTVNKHNLVVQVSLIYSLLLFTMLSCFRYVFLRLHRRAPKHIAIIEQDDLTEKALSHLESKGCAGLFEFDSFTEKEFFENGIRESQGKKRRFGTIVFPYAGKLSSKHLFTLIEDKFSGAAVCDSLTFFKNCTGSFPVSEIEPRWLVDFSSSIMLMSPVQRRVKRVLDVFLSLVLLFPSLPIMVLLAVLIKLTSKGPIIYKQERVGLHGREFPAHKFRTMVDKAEVKTGPVWTQKNDPRITRVGKIMRKTRLDELPQLFDVLIGNMSFVGPRPIRRVFESENAKTIPFYFIRHLVKPGLTGWAQVSDIDPRALDGPKRRFEYDLFYIHEYSLLLDAVIILKTVQKVLTAKGE